MLVLFTNIFPNNSSKVYASDLMKGITPKKVESVKLSGNFLRSTADFSIELFNSKRTASDINNWVKNNTYNLIGKIIDQIDPNTVMYLINTIYFEDQWLIPYSKRDVRNIPFKLQDGTEKNVDLMHSEEDVYLSDGKAQGFIKPYKDGKCSFVALLPNEGVSIDSYVNSLSGESFINLLKNKSNETVFADLPRFKAGYKINLVDSLKQMGLSDCFGDKANFIKMVTSKPGGIYIDNVLHKTYIAVDTEGTKAGAVTEVDMTKLGIVANAHILTLNRPFVYAVVDNETNLPIFIGTITNPEYK